jgi:enediyne biosynthesis protein E4
MNLTLSVRSWIVFISFLAPLVLGTPSKTSIQVAYSDVTESSGLIFQHCNSATPTKYLVETMTGGVALLDYNNDGWLDAFFVNGAQLGASQPDGQALVKTAPQFWNRLFRNNRDGTFADVTERAGLQGSGYGMGAAVADYNNDGNTDLLVTNYGGVILYRNNGDGTLTDVTLQSGIQVEGWASSAGFLDFDNDGHLDLFVCRYLEWNFTAGAIFCGDTRPGGRSYCHPDKFKPVTNCLYKNNGGGTFTDVSQASQVQRSPGKALGVAFADFNRDGFPDISVANDSFPQSLFKNNGNSTFTEVGTMAGVSYTEDGKVFAGMGTEFADLDNDGLPDIITTALPYQYYGFFQNRGNGRFAYLSLNSRLGEITRRLSGWGIHIFDYDNDGRNDVFLANSHVMDNIELTQPHLRYPQNPLLLRYLDNQFLDISRTSGEVFSQAWTSRGASFGDLDNDGDIDIVVSTCGGKAHFLRNEGGNRNHWIVLKLRGRTSNRGGVGAQILLRTPGGKVQYRQATTAGSYLSASDGRVFFGLGEDTTIQEIQIRWPSGLQQTIRSPKADQFLNVEEPGSVP